MAKRHCSLSLDLDNQWSYMKTHGDPGWEELPTYLDVVVPRFIELLNRFKWTITVFVVGQDAALGKNHRALSLIKEAGYEVGNHSFNHEPWLHLYSEDQIDDEISRTEEAISSAIGATPRLFRGPGYSLSRRTLDVLQRRNYILDASTFPTFLGPLARAYYFMTSRFTAEEKDKRKALFGGLRDGLRPVKPYRWDVGASGLIEIPVTTMPVFKIPFHFSYLLYLGTYSPGLARLYFKAALTLCRLTGTEPSLLLHPLDFLGGDDVPELAFFPAMNLDGGTKVKMLETYFKILDDRYQVLPIGAYRERILDDSSLALRSTADLPNGESSSSMAQA